MCDRKLTTEYLKVVGTKNQKKYSNKQSLYYHNYVYICTYVSVKH